MKKFVSLLLVLVLVLGTLAGCGKKAEEPTAQAQQPAATPEVKAEAKAEEKVQPEATKPSGRTDLNVSYNQQLTSTDPHATNSVQDWTMLTQIYEALVYYNELTSSVEPCLAESWTIDETGKVYTMKLRSNVYFHNGDKLTADDVVFSLKRVSDSAMSRSTYASAIEDVKKVDDTTVEITLKAPSAPFLVNLTMLCIISEKVVKEQGDAFGTKENLAGTGPYYFASVDVDQKVVMKAFDKYYLGKAAIETVNYFMITDSSAGVMALESGDLDWYNCTVADYQRLKAEGTYATEVMAANHITFLSINPDCGDKAIADERVRQAIAYAINKEEMNFAAFDGLGGIADYICSPSFDVGAPKADVVYNYDPEKAKALLAEAGYPNGVSIGTIMCFTGSHFEICATVLQAQLEAVGIHSELEWAEQSANLARGKAKDYCLYMTGMSGTGDYDSFRKRLSSKVTSSYVDFAKSGYDAEYIDMMLDKGAATVNPEERLKVDAELNDYVMKAAVYLPLLNKCVPYVWNAGLNVVNRSANPKIYEWNWK